MQNQIQVIAPYWLKNAQTWVFDDPATDLVQEPFVSGVPEMIDDLVQDIPNARSGFRLLFSSEPFPGFQRRLEWVREEMGGKRWWGKKRGRSPVTRTPVNQSDAKIETWSRIRYRAGEGEIGYRFTQKKKP